MKLQRLRNSVSRAAMVATCVAAVVACSEPADYRTPSDPDDIGTGEVVIAVSELSAPRIGTRVEMTDAENPQACDTAELRWDEGDTFSLWAAGGDEKPEYKNIKFTYKGSDKYGAGDKVYFSSCEVPAMTAGDYIYTAYYPYQDNDELVDRENNRISYEIPTTQDGTYGGGKYDIMTARAVRSKALVRDWLNDDLDLEFAHETHALKITVPEAANAFGEAITRIRIEFPQPVAGRLSFDTVTGEVITDGLTDNFVDVKFDEPLQNDTPFWVFIAPVDVQGAVKFTAYGGENEKLQCDPSIAREGSFGNLEKAHITPVRLGINKGFSVTWFEYEIVDWSRLGEEIKMLDITLPEGLQLADRSEDAATHTKKIQPESDGKFKIAFRTEELLHLPSAVTMTAGLESEHAIVAPYASDNDKFTIEPDGYEPDGLNARKIEVVPYLFEEDFSQVTTFHNEDEWSNSASTSNNHNYGPFLGGWTGGRIGGLAGVAIRIACRRQTAVTTMSARVDSPQMRNLKDGATVKVVVYYDYGMDRWGSKGLLGTSNGRDGGEDYYQTVYLGYVKDANNTVYNASNTTITEVTNFQINELAPSGDQMAGYNDIPHKNASYDIFDCDNITRLTWRTVPQSGGGANNNTFWFYIDNVKVSIAQ